MVRRLFGAVFTVPSKTVRRHFGADSFGAVKVGANTLGANKLGASKLGAQTIGFHQSVLSRQ